MTPLHTARNSINELNTKLTTALVGVHTWCTSNSMVINEKKTNTMVVCTYQKEARIDSTDLQVLYNVSYLENVSSKKLLGVTIEKHLT